jgi:phosphohistidine swiveling domain-containing protein
MALTFGVFGNKAKGLASLQGHGFRTLPFTSVCVDGDLVKMDTEQVSEAIVSQIGVSNFYAVRSSSITEDTDESAAAGQFKTLLGITKESLAEAIKEVAESLPKLADEEEPHGVIIQPLLHSSESISGVLFTHEERWMVNYAPGLCNYVVQGFEVAQRGFHPSGKSWMIKGADLRQGQLFDAGAGHILTKEFETNKWPQHLERALLQLYRKVQQHYGKPMDVEWTFVDRQLYVLQIRPVTVDWLPELWLFDNSNLAESYTGTVSPMTASVARRLYKYVYEDLLTHSGVLKQTVRRHQYVFDNLVKDFNGRMYYVMNHWYSMMFFLPGYERNKENLERMITAEIRQEIFLPESMRPANWLKIAYYPLMLWKVLCFPWTKYRFNRIVQKDFNALGRTNFSTITTPELQSLWNKCERRWLRRWYVTVESDTVLMTFLGWAEKKFSPEELQNFLSVETPSVKQLRDFKALAHEVMQAAPLKEALLAADESTFLTRLEQNQGLQERWTTYFSVFGGRFPNELKLESPSPMDDFSALSNAIQEIASSPLLSKGPQAHQQLPWGINQLQRYIKQREAFRLLRSTAFGWLRRILLQAGINAAKADHIQEPDDIFYLKIEEWFAGNTDSWKNLITVRKAQYAEHSADRYPRSFATTPSGEAPPYIPAAATGESVEGQCVFPGVVHGRLLVMDEYRPGPWPEFDILVAKHTDPGWSMLISKAKGLVVEQGGLLSHASIVTRELGIPCIIGAPNATALLEDGGKAVLDAASGTLKPIL